MVRQRTWVFLAAAASTAIAGIIHFVIAYQTVQLHNMMLAFLFIVMGAGQLFYALPVIMGWGRSWYYGGLIGTALTIIFWLGARVPSARVVGGFTGLLPMDSLAIAVLVFDFAALLLSIRLIQTATTPSKDSKKEQRRGFGAAAQ